jgi:hypothetical protein
MDSARSVQAFFKLEAPFYFDSVRSAARGGYVTISVANENFMNSNCFMLMLVCFNSSSVKSIITALYVALFCLGAPHTV